MQFVDDQNVDWYWGTLKEKAAIYVGPFVGAWLTVAIIGSNFVDAHGIPRPTRARGNRKGKKRGFLKIVPGLG